MEPNPHIRYYVKERLQNNLMVLGKLNTHNDRPANVDLFKLEHHDNIYKLRRDDNWSMDSSEGRKKKDIFSSFVANMRAIPQRLSNGARVMKDRMELLGFFTYAASLHYFTYSIGLLLWATIIMIVLAGTDSAKIFMVSNEGFPMIMLGTSFFQLSLCVLTLLTGCCVIQTNNMCAVNTYLVFVVLTIVAIINNAAVRYHFSRESVIAGYMKTYVENYHSRSPPQIDDFMAIIQRGLDCCGAKGPLDYANGKDKDFTFLPLSCCSEHYKAIIEEDRKFCYLVENFQNSKTQRRDRLMRQIVSFSGCTKRMTHFMQNRNRFEIIFTAFFVIVFLLLILWTLWYRKQLKLIYEDQKIRKKLHQNQRKPSKNFWGIVRNRLVGEDSLHNVVIHILRHGIYACEDKDEIREFLAHCKPAKEVLINRNPIELAEDIVKDNTVPGLSHSLRRIVTTHSEEYENRLTDSTSILALCVKGNQERAAAEKARGQKEKMANYFKDDYVIEERGAKRRKVNRIVPSNTSVTPKVSSNVDDHPPAPPPSTSSIDLHQPHFHRKSLIQLQLKKHIMKEQRTLLAILIAEYQDKQMDIENRQVRYALSHTDVPVEQILALDIDTLEEGEESVNNKGSFKEIYVKRRATHTLIEPKRTYLEGLEEIDETTSTFSVELKQIKDNDPNSIILARLKREETWTVLPAPNSVQEIHIETREMATQVRAPDLAPERVALATQTVPREKEE